MLYSQAFTCCLPSSSQRACWTCCSSLWATVTVAARPCSPSSIPSFSLSGIRRWLESTAGRNKPLLFFFFYPSNNLLFSGQMFFLFFLLNTSLADISTSPSAEQLWVLWPTAAQVAASGPLTCRGDIICPFCDLSVLMKVTDNVLSFVTRLWAIEASFARALFFIPTKRTTEKLAFRLTGNTSNISASRSGIFLCVCG